MQQVAVLEGIAKGGGIEAETLREVRSALERDIAWLTEFDAGEVSGEWGGVEVGEVSKEAARILVELLLGDGD